MARRDLEAQVAALSAQLEALRVRMDADQRSLGEITGAIRVLRAEIAAGSPSAEGGEIAARSPDGEGGEIAAGSLSVEGGEITARSPSGDAGAPEAAAPEASVPEDAPPPPPPPPPPRRPFEPAYVTFLRRVAVVTALVALAIGAPCCCLYFSCDPIQNDVDAWAWRGTSTFTCPRDGEITLSDRKVRLASGAAITFDYHCSLKLVRCDIKAPVGIEMSGYDGRLELIDSRIEGTEAAIKVTSQATIEAARTRVTGLVMAPPETRMHGVVAVPASEIRGAPHAVDPGAQIELARHVAGIDGSAKVSAIVADLVGSNGLVDLDATGYQGRITYTFETPLEVPPPPPRPRSIPLGAPLPIPADPPPMRRILRVVSLDREGMRYASMTADTQPSRSRPSPRCSFKEVWDAARTGDAPAAAVAKIQYTGDVDRDAFQFSIEGTPFSFAIDDETCKRKGAR